MRIHCTTTFLDGPLRFEKDDICTVPQADAERFIAAGWAVEYGKQAPAVAAGELATLTIHKARNGAKDTHHG